MASIENREHPSIHPFSSLRGIQYLRSCRQPPPNPCLCPRSYLLFEYPDADVILRSSDSYEFGVLKMHVVHSSPILGEKVLISPNPQPGPTPTIPTEPDNAGTNAPCVVQLPIEGAILFSLLSYIFPVPPILPSTVEKVIKLLSVAQMYKMDVVLTHIRNHIAQQEPPFIRKKTAFLIYSLSLKHGLRPEALQAARCTLSFSSLTIRDLATENVLDMMPTTFFHELWKYHQRVRSNLSLGLKEYETSNVIVMLGDLDCQSANSSIPSWLESYISTIRKGPITAFLDLTDFHMALAKHTRGRIEKETFVPACESCSGIPREIIHALWRALTAVVRDSISKAEPDFAFPIEGTWSESPTREATSPPKYSNMPNADVILQSSDLVNFRVHKSALATSSPLFSDMFTLPQPPNGTASDELPVVHVSEDAVILNSLISMLYPVPPEMPDSSDDSLALLAAAAKYDMDTIRSSIREEIGRKKLFSSTRAGLFRVYAVAYRKRLIPEMAMAARLTVDHPLTFKSLGDTVWLFEGRALRDLADFRLRGMDKFLGLHLDADTEPTNIWVNCPMAHSGGRGPAVPSWFQDLQSRFMRVDDDFTEAIPTSQKFFDEYLKALQSHIKETNCQFCMNAHVMEGERFRTEMEDVWTQAWDVPHPMQGG